MENKPREEIAIALFTGAVIALFLITADLLEPFYLRIIVLKIIILSILIVIIVISLKIILDRSSDLHFIGSIIRKILRIRTKN